MKTFLFLISLLATLIVSQTCPNDCSGMGTCGNNGVCQCQPDRVGNDCSIFQKALTRDTWVSGSVDIWSWNFYTFATGMGAGNVRFQVEATDDSGDCDLYVQFGERPDRLNYDVKDTDTSSDATVDINSPSAGTWYAGVFGFYPCEYRIRVQFLGSCEQPCGAHGTCRGGSCVCDQGWSGPACDHNSNAMTIGQLYQGHVNEGQWKVYKLNLAQQYSSVLVHLNQTGTAANQDCDLYARFGDVPTEYEWDYFDQNWRETYSAVNLADPQQGDWFIGVFGYSECSFKIKADITTGCPNHCSRRGVCQNGVCRCQIGYSGTYCEDTAEGILLGQLLNGYVEYLTWNFYHIATESQSSLLVTVTQESASSDCDIYVRRDQRPTATLYDYYDVSYEQTTHVTIPSPGVATWHIGIFGASYETPCTYTLTTTVTGDCQGCVHGECLEFGYCDCETGWAGERCDTGVTPITSGQVITGSIAPRTWKYFSMESTASTIVVSLRETNTVGFVWLYQALEISPTLRYYDDNDIDTDSSFHSITIDASWWADPDYPYTYYFGVYGSPFAARDVEFSLVAWETPYKK